MFRGGAILEKRFWRNPIRVTMETTYGNDAKKANRRIGLLMALITDEQT